MTPVITAPLENYLYVAGVVIIVAWIAFIYSSLSRSVKRRGPWIATRKAYYRPAGWRTHLNLLPVDGGEQLRAVMAGRFEKQRLLNGGEYRVFKTIEDCVRSHRRGYRVFAQANLGEILSSRDEQAFRAINSKRVDILIVDQGGWPVLAVEFQGGGHYQGSATIRDAVKKAALKKAGVGYVEVFPGDTAKEIELRIQERLGWKPRLLPPQQAEPSSRILSLFLTWLRGGRRCSSRTGI